MEGWRFGEAAASSCGPRVASTREAMVDWSATLPRWSATT